MDILSKKGLQIMGVSLVLGILLSVFTCNYLSVHTIDMVGMGSGHSAGVALGHIDHAQSLILAKVSLISMFGLLILITYAYVGSFSILLNVDKKVSFITVESDVYINHFRQRTCSSRAPPV